MNTPGIYFGKLESDETFAGCIDVYRNIILSPGEIIDLIENECHLPNSGMTWKRAETIGAGVYQNQRTNYHLSITDAAETQKNLVARNIHNQIIFLLQAAVYSYTEKYAIKQDLYPEYFNILKYETGQEYTAHYDGGTETKRSVSALLYLNDEFSGGETEFVNFNIKIKPEPGMLVLFPSNYAYRHIAHPVLTGTKYAVVTWFADRL